MTMTDKIFASQRATLSYNPTGRRFAEFTTHAVGERCLDIAKEKHELYPNALIQMRPGFDYSGEEVWTFKPAK